MQLKKIKVGRTYETTHGEGEVLRVGGTFPPSVRVRILRPIVRGDIELTAREVLREVLDPKKPL